MTTALTRTDFHMPQVESQMRSFLATPFFPIVPFFAVFCCFRTVLLLAILKFLATSTLESWQAVRGSPISPGTVCAATGVLAGTGTVGPPVVGAATGVLTTWN